MIHLEKITPRNYWDIVCLKVFRDQKSFVASNKDSIVEAYAAIDSDCTAFPFGIYDGDKPVGFLMIGFNEAALYEFDEDIEAPEAYKNSYTIWRLMIDKRYQKRGYGRKALQLAVDFIRTWPCGKSEHCAISWEPENETAGKLYRSFGFVENGELDGDEIVAVLKL